MKWALLTTLALLLVTPVTVGAAPRPGASGIGDPYFAHDGNGGYDVSHYGLKLTYTPKTRILRGVATITATATQDLSRLNLDLRGLTVRSARVGGRAARVRRMGQELTLVPRAALTKGRPFTVVIAYDGRPRPVSESSLGGQDGFLATDDGALVAGEPHGAAGWFPVNDHPRDKASYSFAIDVPRGVKAVANGVLTGTERRGGRTIWHWHAAEPMASYLATATIGQFAITTRIVDGLTYVDAVDPDVLTSPQAPTVRAAVAREPEMVAFLAGVLGAYPFSAAGSIIDDERINFALETQTRPIYSSIFFTSRDDAESVLVHELAHQWAGDHVSVARWRDVWLNEGLATYAEWLWSEHEGRRSAEAAFAAQFDRQAASSPFWRIDIADPGRRRLFSAPVYQRGAMALHALRTTIGDAAFFALLKAWVSEHAGGSVTTEDFVALAERVSGRDLGSFFATWLRAPRKPPSS